MNNVFRLSRICSDPTELQLTLTKEQKTLTKSTTEPYTCRHGIVYHVTDNYLSVTKADLQYMCQNLPCANLSLRPVEEGAYLSSYESSPKTGYPLIILKLESTDNEPNKNNEIAFSIDMASITENCEHLYLASIEHVTDIDEAISLILISL